MKSMKVWAKSLAIRSSAVGGMCLVLSSPVLADYQQRLSLGVGVVSVSSPSQISFAVNGEYEYRLNSAIGLGTGANYVFSSPALVLVAVPEVFLHPFGGEFFVSAAPLIEYRPGLGTNLGARLGTRLPIELGAVKVLPTFSVDLANGGVLDMMIGLGIQFGG